MALIPVILAGGSGHRLWPLSNGETPKVFLPVEKDKTLLQITIERALLLDCSDIIIIINEKHLPLLHQLLKNIKRAVNYHFILEPFGRNTAPAIAAALQYTKHTLGENHSLLVLPADHIIKDSQGFIKAIEETLKLNANTHLVTFGTIPACPHTGYGYIQIENTTSEQALQFNVKRFVEKPSMEKAVEYVHSKQYLWNMGMFFFPVNVLEREMRAHAHTLMTLMDKLWLASQVNSDNNTFYLNPPIFEEIPNVSIDYELMEKTNCIKVMPVDIGWSDLGDWLTFSSLFPKNDQNNTTVGEVELVDSNNIFVYNTEQKPIGILGVRDLVVVNHENGILIIDAAQTQQVKTLVNNIGKKELSAWGHLKLLTDTSDYKIQTIYLRGDSKISHTSDGIVSLTVLKGALQIAVNDKIRGLSRGEYISIAANVPYELINETSDEIVISETHLKVPHGD